MGAYNQLQKDETVTNVVILLSDGFPNLPRGNTANPFDNEHAIKEAAKAAGRIKSSNSIIFTVGFDFEQDGGLLEALASNKAYHFKASSAQSLKSAYNQIESKLCR